MASLFLSSVFGSTCTRLGKLQKIGFDRSETERPQANEFAWVKLMRRFFDCFGGNQINPFVQGFKPVPARRFRF